MAGAEGYKEDTKMRSLLRERRGQIQIAVAMIVSLAIGVIVIGYLFASMPAPTGATALATYNQIQSFGWIAITLLSLGLIVFAAMVILSYVRGGRGAGV